MTIFHKRYTDGLLDIDAEGLLEARLGFPISGNPMFVGAAQALSATNAAFFGRVTGAGTITKLAVHVGTSSGNISMAVYANSGVGLAAIPGARQDTTGAVACPATGYQEVALGGSVDVVAGMWFALSADNTTATFLPVAASTGITNLGKGFGMSGATQHPCPATAGGSSYRCNPFIIVGVA